MARLSPIRAAALGLALALFGAGVAEAQPRRIVIQDFAGRGATSVRADAVRSLRGVDGVTVLPRTDLTRAARRMHVHLRRERDYARVARALRVDAFVEGRVRTRGGYAAEVRVRDATGAIVTETQFFAGGRGELGRVIRGGFWEQLAPAILGAEGGEAPQPDVDLAFGEPARASDAHARHEAAHDDRSAHALDDERPPPPTSIAVDTAARDRARRESLESRALRRR